MPQDNSWLNQMKLPSSTIVVVSFSTFCSAQTPFICNEALQAHRSANFALAVGQYQQCLEQQPGNFEARSNLGAVLVQLGRFEEAIAAYRSALASAPAAVEGALRRNLALAFYKSGQVPEAARELSNVHEREPADRQTFLLLADCYLLLGEPQKTVALFDSATSATEDPAGDYLLGTALIRSGDVARGKVVIDRILRRSDSAESHMLLGAGMFEARDYPSAVKEFSLAEKIDPELPLVHSYLGQALLTTGDAQGAALAFQKELAVNPNDFEANLKLGEILTARGQVQEALPLLWHAATVRPSAADAHLALAGAYTISGAGPELKKERQWLSEHGVSAAKPAVADGPALGSKAPDVSLAAHGGGSPVTLANFRGHSPVLLIFASYSCPQFRMQAAALNGLYERFHTRVPFLLVYIREAHAGAAWQSSINQREGINVPEAKSMAAKQKNADLCIRKLKIPYSAAVDDLDGAGEKAYAAWPSRVYLVGTDGKIAFESHLDEQEFRAAALQAALEKSVARAR